MVRATAVVRARRAAAIVLVLLLLILAMPAGAVAPRPGVPHTGGGPSARVDVRRQGIPVAPSGRAIRARTQLARKLGTLGVIQSDPTTGTLRFVGRLDGFLTRRSDRTAASIALRYVSRHLDAFGLRRGDLRTLHLRKRSVDIGGTRHLSWVQRAGGLTVFGQGLRANVTADGRLINVTGGPVAGLRAPSEAVRLGAGAAIATARASAGAAVAPERRDRAELVLFPTGRGARQAWRTTTFVASNEIDLSIVDAVTGEVLYRDNMVDSGVIPTGDGEAWPFYPSTIPPNSGGVETGVSFPVFDGTALSGPNAHVFKDVKDDNVADPGDEIQALAGLDWTGYDPTFLDTANLAQNCSTARACTWDKSVAYSWKENLKHNAVQVYWFLNEFHDHLEAAPIGFNEAAGNFETDDPVLGHVSDGANTAGGGFPDLSHVDNANMFTPPDGESPIMQMYLFKELPRFGLFVPSANGGDDAEVVYHEYTHGLSNRLVIYPGGESGLDNQQAGSMGEAWSDWYALDFLAEGGYKPDPAGDGDVVMGELSFNSMLRSESVDCSVGSANAACLGTPDAGTGGYTYGDFGLVAGFPETHADGEIWLQTLWQLRQDLGGSTTRELVTRAMELSPPSPSFLDMRNAIVQADVVANAGANEAAIWAVFANRGMGYFASSMGGHDLTPVEDFTTPPDCAVDPCGNISGNVTDAGTGLPLQAATVGIAGLNTSGFGAALSATTDVDGDYTIVDVPDHDSYGALLTSATGYEQNLQLDFVVAGDATVDKALIRNWAAIEGGATLVKFSPPDYSAFCGRGGDGAFDNLLSTGWPSDRVGVAFGSNYAGKRRAVVELPQTVDVTSFGVASGGTCGDGPDAGVKRFLIQTRTLNGTKWRLAVDAKAPANGKLKTYLPTGGRYNVRFVRVVMITNHGNPLFLDVLEVTVRGT